MIQKMTDEQWDTIVDVNLKAPFRILRAAQPFIKANPTEYHRKVVNVSSVSGYYGNAGQSNYAAAKAGLIGLTKTLAKEWGRYRVNVNAVAFGLIITRMTEVSADANATLTIDGREIRVGVNPDRLAVASKMIPFGEAALRWKPRGRCTCCALPNRTTSTASASSSTPDASDPKHVISPQIFRSAS